MYESNAHDALTTVGAQPEQTTESPQTTSTDLASITNREFLAAIFSELGDTERPIVLGIPGAIDKSTKWGTGTAWHGAVETGDRALNWFFTLSTYKPEGSKYRRTKAQFHRAYGVYLDDVGTKAAARERLDACPPSYMVETSPGNFHAGYLFDEPCSDLARIEGLQEALVRAGLCDPGAKGPAARVGRMPCAINGKYRPPHPCKLVEWHPERRYTIEQIFAKLELEPLEPAGKRHSPKSLARAIDRSAESDVYRPRAAENAVLRALRQRGLYKRPLGSGRHDITCPWVGEHTGAVDQGTAYFEPEDRYPIGGFKCQHSHGDTKHMGALLVFLNVTFTAAKHKPSICVAAGELHRVVDAAEHELAASGHHYQRGGLIVVVVTDPGTSETCIKAATANGLMRALSSCATWERLDARSGDFVVTDPPTKHVNVLFDADAYQHLPVLRGIARQPYLRQDGSLMSTAGFDATSGMFGAFDERSFKIPAAPDRASALEALVELQGLLGEFGFANATDRAAVLAAMLTAAIRPALRLAPMFHVKAPQVSSGKSYLCDLITAFAGPSKPPAYAFPATDEECEKLLLSVLLEAPPALVFDNLTSDIFPFKKLCSALTEEFVSGRILGISKTATVPTQTLFLSSGNNVDPVRDMARRVVTIHLDPACETPATRKYRDDPVLTVRQRREHFVSLALTIVRAYIVAECPAPSEPLTPLGSYGDWSRLVRAALVWLGQPDAASSVFTRLAEDPDREALWRLLVAWRAVFKGEPATVRDASGWSNEGLPDDNQRELQDAMREIAEERGVINRKRLGKWISRHQGRIVNGLKFERGGARDGRERWRVVEVV